MKRILMVFAIAATAGTLSAQKSDQSRIDFSVHVDPQFSWLSSDDNSVVSDGSIFHVQAGLRMDYFFEKNYAFYIGFGINNVGGKLLNNDTAGIIYMHNDSELIVNPDQSFKLNLQYLDIPLGLKLQTEELGYLTIFFQAGFNPMVNINAYLSSEDETNSFEKENFKDNVPIFNFGYHLGAGVEYRLGGNTAAVAGIRWSSGLTDVTEIDFPRLTSNVISINLGVLFLKACASLLHS